MKNILYKQISAFAIVLISILKLHSESLINESFLKNINTDGDETSCSITEDGKFFIFARKLKGKNTGDLFYSEFKNEKWTNAKAVSELNTDANEISPYISPDGKFVLFSSNRNGSLKSSSADKTSYDIYYSERKGDGWDKPKLLFGAINSTDDEFNPYVTNDGKILFFTRSPFNDSSKPTVISVYKKNESWEDVRTADISKNTSADIYMYKKIPNKSISIVTGFKKGELKNRDTFYSNDSDRSIIELKGTDSPINTGGDELSINDLDGDSVILSTNSSGISGSYDFFIRKIITEKAKSLPGSEFSVKAESDGKINPANVKVKILFFSSLKKNSWPADSKIASPDAAGLININADKKTKRILIIPGEPGIKSFAVEFLTANKNIKTATIRIEPSDEKEFSTQPVYFNFNSSEIKISEIPYVHRLIDYLRNNNSSRITLEGYSDGVGSYKSNINISLRRAQSVKNYLIKAGINKNRINAKGLGYREDKTSDTAQYNRRVDTTIIQ